MAVDKNFEGFVDEVTEAEFEYDDLVRVVSDYHHEGIDRFDSEKLLSDFCGLRYRYTFLYIAIAVIHAISRPKKSHKQSIRHLRRAITLLSEMVHQMERVHAIDEENDKEASHEGEGNDQAKGEGDNQEDPETP